MSNEGRPALHRPAAAIAAVLLMLLSPRSGLAAPSAQLKVDFAEIWRLAEAYRTMRYDALPAIHEELDPSYDGLLVVDLEKTQNRYMLGTLEDERCHVIWIRGTATTKNAFTDLEFTKHRDPRLGINLHHGFAAYASAVHDDVLPRLHPGFDILIFGHSLGAAEATILGMLLSSEGWNVKRVYASGCPRLTDAEGARKFASLPVIRIINEGDPVPLLPPRTLVSPKDPYVHLGPAVVLLDGPGYCLIGEQYGDEALGPEVWRTVIESGLRQDVREHFIGSYLERLAPKQLRSILVPWDERARYLPLRGGVHEPPRSPP
jgi:hypothetical protein